MALAELEDLLKFFKKRKLKKLLLGMTAQK